MSAFMHCSWDITTPASDYIALRSLIKSMTSWPMTLLLPTRRACVILWPWPWPWPSNLENLDKPPVDCAYSIISRSRAVTTSIQRRVVHGLGRPTGWVELGWVGLGHRSETFLKILKFGTVGFFWLLKYIPDNMIMINTDKWVIPDKLSLTVIY